MSRSLHKAWVVAINMGYGHERAAYGLKELAYGDIIVANDYPGIPTQDKELWKQSRSLYEYFSRLQPLPVVGQPLFDVMDHFQKIPPFYPRRDLSEPTLQVSESYRWIEKKQLGKDLIERLTKRNSRIPFISTFFLPAFAAEVFDYPGDIYCVICDTDVSRAWVPLDPKKSRIKYLAPNGRVVERLQLYGVPRERIFLTGFPLPKTLIGGPEAKIVKHDLAERLCHLDPEGIFSQKYQETLVQTLGPRLCNLTSKRLLTLTFCVGGAGAQKQLGMDIIESLRKPILQKRIRVNLEAGTHKHIYRYFQDGIQTLGLKSALGKSLHIHHYEDRREYFLGFQHTLRTTDVLWTKPSELSFYTGLGLPIIIAPSIGSQEDFNRLWLQSVGGGMSQFDPHYTNEWLFDCLASGGLARFAWNGYIEAPTHGAYRIESLITGNPTPLPNLPLIV
ncbi:hypothetical protein KBD61_03405 [Patescibacteria group bacterium]|nr:hypothetical protein [Patescibacteria group bacterium]MBP9710043.1 hypothetical protein [Patescibacteria group bacterium]